MAAIARVIEVYEQHVRPLSVDEQLELLALVARELTVQSKLPSRAAERDIMELRGLGKEIWQGVDAQEYVNRLRDEWDRPNA
jgi:hypothetical protein